MFNLFNLFPKATPDSPRASKLVREYIALGDKNKLNEAIKILQSSNELKYSELIEFLIAAKIDDWEKVKKANLVRTTQIDNWHLIARLVQIKYIASLVSIYTQYPIEQHVRILKMGINASIEAIDISMRLEDKSCEARFRFLLARGFQENRDYQNAKKSYTESLEIYRKLAEENQSAFLRVVATTLNNLANLQRDLKELQEAKKSHTEALKIRRKLAEGNPIVFLPDVAATLNNLGNLQRDLQELQEAKNSYTEALQIYRKLAETNPSVFLSAVAMTLNNMGSLQRDPKELQEAKNLYTEALQIYRKLAETNPSAFLSAVAMTLNNLGVSQRDLQELQKAKNSYTEALQIYRKLAETNPSVFLSAVAMTLDNLGILQGDLREFEESKKSFIEALEIVNKIKNSINAENIEHLHVFKSNIENAVMGLLEFYYKEDTNIAVDLIETLRNIEVLADVSTDKPCEKSSLLDNETVLSFERTNKSYFFATSSSQGHPIEKLDDFEVNLLDRAFDNLALEVWRFFKQYEATRQAENIILMNALPNTFNETIKEKGREVFNLLPDNIKILLNSKTDKQIFLSLGSTMINTPFEFLVNDNNEFVGQVHLLPRVQGISMLNKLRGNNGVDLSKNKLLVSNPTNNLPLSDLEIAEIQKLFNNTFNKNIVSIQQDQALKNSILEQLVPDLAVFHYSGHGTPPDGLVMADELNNLYSRDLVGKSFNNNPLVFISSCMSGQTSYNRGGNFKGMNTAFLSLGAQAVISSVYPVFDRLAMNFGHKVYKNFLEGKTIGESIMTARKESKNVFEWGLHIFYGNPELKKK